MSGAIRAIDPVAQIRLLGKLKLMDCANCARVGNHAGFLLDQVLPLWWTRGARVPARVAARAATVPGVVNLIVVKAITLDLTRAVSH